MVALIMPSTRRGSIVSERRRIELNFRGILRSFYGRDSVTSLMEAASLPNYTRELRICSPVPGFTVAIETRGDRLTAAGGSDTFPYAGIARAGVYEFALL